MAAIDSEEKSINAAARQKLLAASVTVTKK